MDYGDSMDNDRLSAVSAIALHALLGGAPKFTQDILAGGFRSAREVFSFDREHGGRFLEAFRRRAGVPDEDALFRKAEREYGRLGGEGCRFVSIFDAFYPALLRDCPDAPLLLYVRSVSSPEEVFQGTPGRGAGFPISVVGTRDMSPYGRHWCRETVRALADTGATPTIVSGLAFGADICAHLAALEYGLPTIAVLPCGIDCTYPRSHDAYARRIASTPRCALITDYPPGTMLHKSNFLRRNRIIAGLSRCTILVESRTRGGGMMTSRLASGYGREVYAIPGRIDDMRSGGCNLLIAEKTAEPLISPRLLCTTLGLASEGHAARAGAATPPAALEGCSREEQTLASALLRALREYPGADAETLCTVTGQDFGPVSAMLTRLESADIISSDLSGQCSLNLKND